jgi:hypothetical protein
MFNYIYIYKRLRIGVFCELVGAGPMKLGGNSDRNHIWFISLEDHLGHMINSLYIGMHIQI